MVTGVFTGLEQQQWNKKQGLIRFGQRSGLTPYYQPYDYADPSVGYFTSMPSEHTKALRYALKHNKPIERFGAISQWDMALALPENFGLPVAAGIDEYTPSTEENVMTNPLYIPYEGNVVRTWGGGGSASPASETQRRIQESNRMLAQGRLPQDIMAAYAEQGFTPTEYQQKLLARNIYGTGQGQRGATFTPEQVQGILTSKEPPAVTSEGYPGIANREQYEQYLRDKGFQGDLTSYWKQYQEQFTPSTITRIDTVQTPDMGVKVGSKVAILSTGETIPISDDIAANWRGEKPPQGIKLPPGAIYVGGDYYLPAEIKKYAIPVPEHDLWVGVEEPLSPEEVDKIQYSNYQDYLDLTEAIESVYPYDDFIKDAAQVGRWLSYEDPAQTGFFPNMVKLKQDIFRTGRTPKTELLLRMIAPEITEEQIDQFFAPITPVVSQESPFAQDSLKARYEAEKKAAITPTGALSAEEARIRQAQMRGEFPYPGQYSDAEMKSREDVLKQAREAKQLTIPDTGMFVVQEFAKWFENPIKIPPAIAKVLSKELAMNPEISPAEIMESLDPIFFGVPGGISLRNAEIALRNATKAAEKAGKAAEMLAKVETGAAFGGKEAKTGEDIARTLGLTFEGKTTGVNKPLGMKFTDPKTGDVVYGNTLEEVRGNIGKTAGQVPKVTPEGAIPKAEAGEWKLIEKTGDKPSFLVYRGDMVAPQGLLSVSNKYDAETALGILNAKEGVEYSPALAKQAYQHFSGATAEEERWLKNQARPVQEVPLKERALWKTKPPTPETVTPMTPQEVDEFFASQKVPKPIPSVEGIKPPAPEITVPEGTKVEIGEGGIKLTRPESEIQIEEAFLDADTRPKFDVAKKTVLSHLREVKERVTGEELRYVEQQEDSLRKLTYETWKKEGWGEAIKPPTVPEVTRPFTPLTTEGEREARIAYYHKEAQKWRQVADDITKQPTSKEGETRYGIAIQKAEGFEAQAKQLEQSVKPPAVETPLVKEQFPIYFGKDIPSTTQNKINSWLQEIPQRDRIKIAQIEINAAEVEVVNPKARAIHFPNEQRIVFKDIQTLENKETFFHELGHNVFQSLSPEEKEAFRQLSTKIPKLLVGSIYSPMKGRLSLEESFSRAYAYNSALPRQLKKEAPVVTSFFERYFPKSKTPLVKEGITGGVPPTKPPAQTVTLPTPPTTPTGTEIDRIITQSQEVARQDRPGGLKRLTLKIPGIKQILEAERPGLKVAGKEYEDVLTSMIAWEAAINDVKTWEAGTKSKIFKDIREAFGKNVLRGGKSEIKFLGTAEQSKNRITGTFKDIAENPELYELSSDQKRVLEALQDRSDFGREWVVDKYKAEIGQFQPKPGGAYLPSVDVADDVIEYLGSETAALHIGRGKTRVWQTARERMEHDPTFVPELDVQKLITAIDDFHAWEAGKQTYLQAIGGLTRAEAIEKTHPALFAKWTALQKQLNSLKGSAATIESNIKKAIYDFEHSPIEGTDLLTLRDALDVKLKGGPRVGFDVVAVQDEIAKVREVISELKPAWEVANLKPYHLVQEGIFRYFPGEEANLIRETLEKSHNPFFNFLEYWRGGAFSGDFSPYFIQGAVAALAHPLGTAKAMVGSLATGIKKGDFFRSFKLEALADDIFNNPVEWAQYASLRGRTVSGTPTEYAAGWMTKIPFIGKGIGKFTDTTYIAVTRGDFNLWKTNTKWLMKHGVPELEAKVASSSIGGMVYPFAQRAALGQSRARAAFLRALPTSYSFIRQPASLIEQAVNGFAKVIIQKPAVVVGKGLGKEVGELGKLTPKESLAMKMITNMAVSVIGVSTASAVATAVFRGKSEEEIKQAFLDAINPEPYNGKFASMIVPIGDKDIRVPLGGPYRAIFRAVYPQEVPGVPFPVPFYGLLHWDGKRNRPDGYIWNRITPAIRTQVDLIMNKDYWGNPILKGGAFEILARGLAYEFEGALPLTVGEAVEKVRLGEKYREELPQQMIGQFMGVNPVTLDNTYLDRQERQLGLPEELENTEPKPFSIQQPKIYDVKDFWTDTNRVISDIKTEDMSKRNFKPKAQSVAEARDIKKSLDDMPNQKLTDVNADPGKGDTFIQYYEQWLQRKVLGDDKKKLAEFDKKYPDAKLGNMSQSQFVLLWQYNNLTDKKQKAQFLKDHPEIDQNPHEEWLRSHPDDNAKLAVWGQAKVMTQAAYDKTMALAKTLDIPMGALQDYIPPKEVAKDYFELQDKADKFGTNSAEASLILANNPKLGEWLKRKPIDTPIPALELKVKNRENLDLYESFSDNESPNYIADAKARQQARDGLKTGKPEFADDLRRIEAYQNKADEKVVKSYVDYGKLVDKFKANSSEARLFRYDNPDMEEWGRTNLGWEPVNVKSPEALKLQVKNRDLETQYQAIKGRTLQDEQYLQENFLKAHGQFAADRLKVDGLNLGLPTKLADNYAEYQIQMKYKATPYDDDWYLLEHPDLYRAMTTLDNGWKQRDFSKVPTRNIYNLYLQYEAIPSGQTFARQSFRRANPAFDAWLIIAKGATPLRNPHPLSTQWVQKATQAKPVPRQTPERMAKVRVSRYAVSTTPTERVLRAHKLI